MTTVFSREYRAPFCHWCRDRFEDKQMQYYIIELQSLKFCEKCKHLLENPPDFDPKGSIEEGTTSWKTARLLCLHRDEWKCRICGKSYILTDRPKRDQEIWGLQKKRLWVEVHHIIPKKNGGTHNLKNLITLCEKHHKETYSNDYGGLNITDRLIQLGIQSQLKIAHYGSKAK